MISTERETQATEAESEPDHGSPKADVPQQYRNWRDYAFSEFPEDHDPINR